MTPTRIMWARRMRRPRLDGVFARLLEITLASPPRDPFWITAPPAS